MRTFLSEYQKDYQSYTFGYSEYAIAESSNDFPEIYDRGFLPYSANTDLEVPVFYRARSLRIRLDQFAPSSENRRVDRGIADLNITMRCLSKEDWNLEDPTFLSFCLEYAKQRFSNNAMDPSRLQYIFQRDLGTHFFVFENESGPLGYVYACIHRPFVHYWYSFFDIQYLKSHSLGKWMMFQVTLWAAEKGFEAIYLGTCYGAHSLYKVRDFKGVEFHNGTYWDQDKNLLKAWCKADQDPVVSDRFKSASDPQAYIQKIMTHQ